VDIGGRFQLANGLCYLWQLVERHLDVRSVTVVECFGENQKSMKSTKVRSDDMRLKPKDSYVCPRCGYVLPKEDAVVSGWDSERSLRHVHCPKCGKIITHTP